MEYYSDKIDFFKGQNKKELLEKYGSPLYVYNEDILLSRAREMKNLVNYKNFKVNYSAKANTTIGILQLLRREGLNVDAMSPGEIYIEMEAGFTAEEIFYISNNATIKELTYALERGIITSLDSLSQLETVGKLYKNGVVKNFNGEVAIRINTGVGAGHHDKVITGGKKTKFGINTEYLGDVKNICREYGLTIVGINQHIGSLFMEPESYIQGAKNLINLAKEFENIRFVDLGGGFGIPYKRMQGEQPLDVSKLGEFLTEYIENFVQELGKEIIFKIEPGRYVVAESAMLLGEVTSVKENSGTKFVGCDIGFNVLQRPLVYDSYHEIEIHGIGGDLEEVTVVGNICESGDILGKGRMLPKAAVGDVICINDAGAYGFTMASNYNNRLCPAEILIRSNGEVVVLREREELDCLLRNQRFIEV